MSDAPRFVGSNSNSDWLARVDAAGACYENETKAPRNAPARNARASLRVLSRLIHASIERPKAVGTKSGSNFTELLGNNTTAEMPAPTQNPGVIIRSASLKRKGLAKLQTPVASRKPPSQGSAVFTQKRLCPTGKPFGASHHQPPTTAICTIRISPQRKGQRTCRLIVGLISVKLSPDWANDQLTRRGG